MMMQTQIDEANKLDNRTPVESFNIDVDNNLVQNNSVVTVISEGVVQSEKMIRESNSIMPKLYNFEGDALH